MGCSSRSALGMNNTNNPEALLVAPVRVAQFTILARENSTTRTMTPTSSAATMGAQSAIFVLLCSRSESHREFAAVLVLRSPGLLPAHLQAILCTFGVESQARG